MVEAIELVGSGDKGTTIIAGVCCPVSSPSIGIIHRVLGVQLDRLGVVLDGLVVLLCGK